MAEMNKEKLARILLAVQLPMIVIATGLLGVIAWRIGPMLEEYRTLQTEASGKQKEIDSLDNQIAAKTNALHQLRSAVEKTGSRELKNVAERIVANDSALQGFKVGIYYLAEDAELQKRAEDVFDRLKGAGVLVQKYPEPQPYLDKFPIPAADEVRYESPIEDGQGNSLLRILKSCDPDHSYKPRIVLNRTPNFITVWLKK